MFIMRLLFAGFCVALLAAKTTVAQEGASPKQSPKDPVGSKPHSHFLERVRPILFSKCTGCHGDDPDDIAGGLDLRSRQTLLKGGDSGQPAIVPNRPNESLLLRAVARTNPKLAMPPKESNRLSREEIAAISIWIENGALWPEDSTSVSRAEPDAWSDSKDGVVIPTSGGLSEEWNRRRYNLADIWAYRPVREVAPPALKHPRQTAPANPIDLFISSALDGIGFEHAVPADRRTLIRRATFDLLGLPPSPDEVASFFADSGPGAFDRLVDRLLSTPQYGEQQSRHWLDVVRYADSGGFSNDFERPNAWRYRDYIVRRFNQDAPFNEFIVEQLAGDELDGSDPERALAVGFLRMGPWEHTGMTVAAVTRQQYLDDVTNHVGVVFLGQGLACASCHDHKFDPIPTRDYYRMQAVFAPVQFAEAPLPFLPEENTRGFDAQERRAAARIERSQRALAEIAAKNRRALDSGEKESDEAASKKDDAARRDNFGLGPADLSNRKVHQKYAEYFEREKQRFQPLAFTVYSGPPNGYSSNWLKNPMEARGDAAVPDVHILAGGALASPLDAVQPGALSAVSFATAEPSTSEDAAIPAALAGRRLALAHWIARDDNPLTARVIVNRVWQQHFGRGLVDTPNNFGKMGGRPSHPELLDWLATWFVEQSWSIKKLHRLIMTSQTYQQSGTRPDARALAERDPSNRLLGRFPARRLAAEEIRDAMLAVSGDLNREVGGPPNFPEINAEVAFQPRHIMGSSAPAYQPSLTRRERHRRTIYAFKRRTLPDPLLEVFNQPGADLSCPRRDETIVVPQALSLLNNAIVHQRALALADRLTPRESIPPIQAGTQGSERSSEGDRIARLFELCYSRPPTEDESLTCRKHIERMTAHHRRHTPKAIALPTTIARSMVEEMTGEDVAWTEELDVLAELERDLMPWQASPETRAFADVCLVIFNSNEFLSLR